MVGLRRERERKERGGKERGRRKRGTEDMVVFEVGSFWTSRYH